MKEQTTKAKKTKTIEFPNEKNNEPADKRKYILKRATLGGLLIFLFVVLYIPSLLNWLSGRHIARDVIRIGSIEEYIGSSGVIIRDEELLEPSVIGGRCVPEIAEGEKTAAHSNIAMIMSDASDELLQAMESINAKIAKALMEKAEKTDFFSEDLAKLDDEIGLQVKNIILACNDGSFEGIERYRLQIGKIIEKKAEIIGENSSDSYINSLLIQKEELQNKINTNTVQIVSDISGIVSYTIDGFETVLTGDRITGLTPEKLDKIREKDLKRQAGNGRVKAGFPAAKIIKGTDIYIAAAIPAINAAAFSVGKRISMRINDVGLETTGVIACINAAGSNRAVIVVQIGRGVDTLSSARVIDVDFISKTEEGLKVPVKCLRDISPDGSKGRIMLLKYNVASNRDVDIICSDNEYAIIRTPEKEYKKTVSLYDIFIINPDNIEEGDIVER